MSYHGNTLGALALARHVPRRKPYLPILHSEVFHAVSPCYKYRYSSAGESDEVYVARLAAELEAKFQGELRLQKVTKLIGRSANSSIWHRTGTGHRRSLLCRDCSRRYLRLHHCRSGLLQSYQGGLRPARRSFLSRRDHVRHRKNGEDACVGVGRS